jgi:lysophospholipase L1-like esterase
MVVILAGTNDIAQNNGIISHKHILDNIISMCELAKIHKIKPVICSVLPAYRFGWRKELEPANEIVRLNAMLREYAQKNGIAYVDYHSEMKDERNGLPENLAKDGVHPTAEGYELMESIVMKVIGK